MRKFSVTLDPPGLDSIDQLYHGLDGNSYAVGGLKGASTFDEYLSNYLRPYINHIVEVDGVDLIYIPNSWNVWEEDPTEYKSRLAKILNICSNSGVEVIVQLWHNETNLSSTFYPLLEMAESTRNNMHRSSAVDRNLFSWFGEYSDVTTDPNFNVKEYTSWTGSYVTISSYSAVSSNAAQLNGLNTALDNRVGPYTSLSSVDMLSIPLPPQVPCAFSGAFKYISSSEGTFSFRVFTTGAAAAIYFWNGREWTTTEHKFLVTSSNTWTYEQVWFETYESSLDNLYSVDISTLASDGGTLSIDRTSLFIVGSAPDCRNYFNPYNTQTSYTYSSPVQMIRAEHGWKGDGLYTGEIVPPFDPTRTRIDLPNPGTYRIRQGKQFLESTVESVSDNNLDVAGGYAYIDDIMTTAKDSKDGGLSLTGYEIFRRPFAYHAPILGDDELKSWFNFIRLSMERVLESANYDSEDIVLTGESAEIFGVTSGINPVVGIPYNEPLIRLWHRERPGKPNEPFDGMDTGSDYAFFPDIEQTGNRIFATDFDAGLYQVVNYADTGNEASAYNSKLWKAGTYIQSAPFAWASLLYQEWEEKVLQSISWAGLSAQWNPSSFLNNVDPYIGEIDSIKTLGPMGPSVTVSLVSVGSKNDNPYFNNGTWSFSSIWLADMIGGPGDYSDIDITLPPLLKNHVAFDSHRRFVSYTNKYSSEYKTFAGYKLASDSNRDAPVGTVVPFTFDENWSNIFAGSSNPSYISGDGSEVSRGLIDSSGNELSIVWSPLEQTVSYNRFLSSPTLFTVFNYEDSDGRLGRYEKDTSIDIKVRAGSTRLLSQNPESRLASSTPNDWSHMWGVLPDFWSREFEDRESLEAMWGAVANIASNMLGHLYQYDMSKSILTVPHKIVASNETVTLDVNTFITESSRTFQDGTSESAASYYLPENVDKIPVMYGDTGSDPTLLKSVTDYDIEDGKIFFKASHSSASLDVLFAPWISYDERMIYNNFGHLVDFQKPESEAYKNAVMAIMYGLYGGHTLQTFRLMCDAVSGVPVIPYRGKIKYAVSTSNTVKIIIEDMFGNEKTFVLPASLSPSEDVPVYLRTGLTTQETVTSLSGLYGKEVYGLAPISSAFNVYDRVSDPARIETIANAIRDKALGMYHTVVGEVSADALDKIGKLYETLGWGTREDIFNDIYAISERIRAQYHLFSMFIKVSKEENIFLREPKLKVNLEFNVEPTLDNNMVTWLGTDWETSKVSTNFGIEQEAFERTSYDPLEDKSHGQNQPISPDGIVNTSSTYASFGTSGLKDYSDSGAGTGFGFIKKVAAKIFKLKPGFDRSEATTLIDRSIVSFRDERGLVKRGFYTSMGDTYETAFVKQMYPAGANNSYYEFNKDSASPTSYLDYSVVPEEVNDITIRPAVDNIGLFSARDFHSYSPSEEMSVMARVRPRSEGVIVELSGVIEGTTSGAPPDVGGCCECVWDNNPEWGNCGNIYPRYWECHDGLTQNDCYSTYGNHARWHNATLCSTDPCPVEEFRCCADKPSDPKCLGGSILFLNCLSSEFGWGCVDTYGTIALCDAGCSEQETVFCCDEVSGFCQDYPGTTCPPPFVRVDECGDCIAMWGGGGAGGGGTGGGT